MKASPHRAAPCGAQPPGSSMNAIPPFAHLCEPAASLEDGHGRTVRYIRLSVTDRCNLRCTYCRSGMETFIPHESVLRYEEMEQLVDMAMDMGVEKVRLTGGEPFARKGFADFLERLRAAHPALDIRVTTNGTLIGPHIQTLKAIGLNAVNLSLDTFDRDKFEQITGRDLFGKVRENMDALLDAGIPFKLNAVAMRGFNDDELPAFIDYAMRHPIDVRFIEFMPMGEGTRWSDSCFWSAPDILDAVKGLVAVAPVEQEQRNGGPARLYTLSGPDGPGLGRLGLISPLSSHFCTSCNRLRITSDGALRTCLFDDREYRLRNALRHPKLGIDFYENLFRELKRLYPTLKLHALGAPEVAHIARISSLDDETTLRRLMDAGLASLPGAGAPGSFLLLLRRLPKRFHHPRSRPPYIRHNPDSVPVPHGNQSGVFGEVQLALRLEPLGPLRRHAVRRPLLGRHSSRRVPLHPCCVHVTKFCGVLRDAAVQNLCYEARRDVAHLRSLIGHDAVNTHFNHVPSPA